MNEKFPPRAAPAAGRFFSAGYCRLFFLALDDEKIDQDADGRAAEQEKGEPPDGIGIRARAAEIGLLRGHGRAVERRHVSDRDKARPFVALPVRPGDAIIPIVGRVDLAEHRHLRVFRQASRREQFGEVGIFVQADGVGEVAFAVLEALRLFEVFLLGQLFAMAFQDEGGGVLPVFLVEHGEDVIQLRLLQFQGRDAFRPALVAQIGEIFRAVERFQLEGDEQGIFRRLHDRKIGACAVENALVRAVHGNGAHGGQGDVESADDEITLVQQIDRLRFDAEREGNRGRVLRLRPDQRFSQRIALARLFARTYVQAIVRKGVDGAGVIDGDLLGEHGHVADFFPRRGGVRKFRFRIAADASVRKGDVQIAVCVRGEQPRRVRKGGFGRAFRRPSLLRRGDAVEIIVGGNEIVYAVHARRADDGALKIGKGIRRRFGRSEVVKGDGGPARRRHRFAVRGEKVRPRGDAHRPDRARRGVVDGNAAVPRVRRQQQFAREAEGGSARKAVFRRGRRTDFIIGERPRRGRILPYAVFAHRVNISVPDGKGGIAPFVGRDGVFGGEVVHVHRRRCVRVVKNAAVYGHGDDRFVLRQRAGKGNIVRPAEDLSAFGIIQYAVVQRQRGAGRNVGNDGFALCGVKLVQRRFPKLRGGDVIDGVRINFKGVAGEARVFRFERRLRVVHAVKEQGNVAEIEVPVLGKLQLLDGVGRGVLVGRMFVTAVRIGGAVVQIDDVSVRNRHVPVRHRNVRRGGEGKVLLVGGGQNQPVRARAVRRRRFVRPYRRFHGARKCSALRKEGGRRRAYA